MAQNNPSRRRAITTSIILALALIGMFMVTANHGGNGSQLLAQAEQNASAITDTTSATTTTYQPMVDTSGAVNSILKMVFALVIVVICIYAGIWLLKKLTARRQGGSRKAFMLEVLETAYIDPKKSLSLVRVADKSVLIGVTDNQISVLTELDTELTKAAMEAASQGTTGDSFSNMLKSATQKLGGFAKKS